MPHDDGPRHVFRDARSGDEILYGDRKNPLTILSQTTNERGARQLTVEGPNGGGPYTLVETDDGGYNKETGETLDRLRFEQREVHDEDSPAGRSISLGEAESIVRDLQHQAMHAYEEFDYPSVGEAVTDVVDQNRERLEGYDVSRADVTTAIKARIPDRPTFGGEPTIEKPEHYDELVNAGATKLTTHFGERKPDGYELEEQALGVAETIISSLEEADKQQLYHFATLGEKVGRLPGEEVHEEARNFLMHDIVEEYRERTDEAFRGDGADYHSASEYFSDLYDEKLEWPEVRDSIGFSPYELAEEWDDRIPKLADGKPLHTFVDELHAFFEKPVLRVWNSWRLADPGIVASAKERKLIWENRANEAVVGLTGFHPDVLPDHLAGTIDRWTVWYQPPEKEYIRNRLPLVGDDKEVMTDGGQQMAPNQQYADLPPGVQGFVVDNTAEGEEPDVIPLFSTDDPAEAYEYAEEFITDGGEAHFQIDEFPGGRTATVKEDVNYEQAARQLFRASGYSIGPVDVPVPTKYAGERTGQGIMTLLGLTATGLGKGARFAGRSIGEGVKLSGQYIYQNFKEPIQTAFAGLFLTGILKGANYLLPNSELHFFANDDRVGWNLGAYARPEEEVSHWGCDACGDRFDSEEAVRSHIETVHDWIVNHANRDVDNHINQPESLDPEMKNSSEWSVSSERLKDRLGLEKRVMWTMGLVEDDEERVDRFMEKLKAYFERGLEWSVMLGSREDLSGRERERLDEEYDEVREVDIDHPDREKKSESPKGARYTGKSGATETTTATDADPDKARELGGILPDLNITSESEAQRTGQAHTGTSREEDTSEENREELGEVLEGRGHGGGEDADGDGGDGPGGGAPDPLSDTDPEQRQRLRDAAAKEIHDTRQEDDEETLSGAPEEDDFETSTAAVEEASAAGLIDEETEAQLWDWFDGGEERGDLMDVYATAGHIDHAGPASRAADRMDEPADDLDPWDGDDDEFTEAQREAKEDTSFDEQLEDDEDDLGDYDNAQYFEDWS